MESSIVPVSAESKKLLLILAAFMEKTAVLLNERLNRPNVPRMDRHRRRFDLSYWATRPTAKRPRRYLNPKITCGFSGCAVGWATAAFSRHRMKHKLALRWDPPTGLSGSDSVQSANIGLWDTENKKFVVDGGDGYQLSSIDSAKRFFGITETVHNYLFMPCSYPPRHQGVRYVAKRIRHFANTGKLMPRTW